MRGAVLCFLSLLAIPATSQNYAFFSSTVKKVFAELPDTSQTYCIAFDSVIADGTDSLYYNWNGLNPGSAMSDTCLFGGSWKWCRFYDYPGWLGNEIRHTSNDVYYFRNILGDTFKIDASIGPGDTSIIFQDLTTPIPLNYSLVFDGKDTMTLWNVIDSVKIYKVLLTMLMGPFSSTTSLSQIITGKNLGLIQFISINPYLPSSSLRLIGTTNPGKGFVSVTKEMIYDFQPGDYFDYQTTHIDYLTPGTDYHSYSRHSILSRTDMGDSIQYQIQIDSFNYTSTLVYTNTFFRTILKSDALAQLPLGRFDGYTNKVTKETFDGIRRIQYVKSWDEEDEYCGPDDCWGQKDFPVGVAPIRKEWTYVEGLGLFKYRQFVDGVAGVYHTRKLECYSKDGTLYGNCTWVGEESKEPEPPQILIHNDLQQRHISIHSPSEIELIEIYTIDGRILLQESQAGNECIIPVNDLSRGIYILRVSSSIGRIYTEKILIQ